MPEKTGVENESVEYGNDTEIKEAVQHATEAISGMIEDPELAAAIGNHRAEAGARWNPGDAKRLSFAFDYATIDMVEEQHMAVAADIAATLHRPASEYPHASASERTAWQPNTGCPHQQARFPTLPERPAEITKRNV